MSNKPSFATRGLLKAMSSATNGRIRFNLPDGSTRDFGRGELLTESTIARWNVFDQILSRGDIGFAETYIEGSFATDHPDRIIQWACTNERAMKKAIYGATWALLSDRVQHWRQRNTLSQARQNIARHYDLGNDFYRLWLDPSLTYSSALFSDPSHSLEDAQASKYERILNQADVREGDHVLEIGCGWGGFFTHAVKTRNCRVTAVTISKAQYEACLQRVRDEGLGDAVEVRLEDYRHIEGRFDRVVSIEMIEAVGRRYWNTYFAKIRASLKAGGRAVIQSITIREDLFRQYAKQTDFIQQYIFPGGQLLPVSQFARVGGLQLVDFHGFAGSYERTLADWRVRFKAAREDVTRLGFSDEFRRMWEFYLAYCEGAFRIDRVGVGHATLEARRA